MERSKNLTEFGRRVFDEFHQTPAQTQEMLVRIDAMFGKETSLEILKRQRILKAQREALKLTREN